MVETGTFLEGYRDACLGDLALATLVYVPVRLANPREEDSSPWHAQAEPLTRLASPVLARR